MAISRKGNRILFSGSNARARPSSSSSSSPSTSTTHPSSHGRRTSRAATPAAPQDPSKSLLKMAGSNAGDPQRAEHPRSELQRAFDPTKPGKYNIRLGESLVNPKGSENEYTSIGYNHKPGQTEGKRRRTMVEPRDRADAPFELSIEDEEDEGEDKRYTYSGRSRDLTHSYILTFDREKQTFELNALPSAFEFNMVSAPWEKDESKLAQQYKQIDLSEVVGSPVDGATSGEDDDAASGTESDGPKEDNPFDYRHYLNGIPSTGTDSKLPSNASTPLLGPKTGHGSPLQPIRHVEPSRPRVNLQRPPPQNKATQANTSKVRFQDRKSLNAPTSAPRSEPENSEDDDDDAGGLIVDEGPPLPSKKRRAAPTPKPNRPMSLHKAAQAKRASQQPESPPQQQEPQEAGSGYEEDDESDFPGKGAGANDDIEDLKLPEPANENRRPTIARRQSTWEEGDEEALQAALEEAFDDEEDDEDAAVPQSTAAAAEGSQSQAVESESESEEE